MRTPLTPCSARSLTAAPSWIPLSAMKGISGGTKGPQTKTVSHIDSKILKIPVIDTKDFSPALKSPRHFPFVMGFDKGIHAKALRHLSVFGQLPIR